MAEQYCKEIGKRKIAVGPSSIYFRRVINTTANCYQIKRLIYITISGKCLEEYPLKRMVEFPLVKYLLTHRYVYIISSGLKSIWKFPTILFLPQPLMRLFFTVFRIPRREILDRPHLCCKSYLCISNQLYKTDIEFSEFIALKTRHGFYIIYMLYLLEL